MDFFPGSCYNSEIEYAWSGRTMELRMVMQIVPMKIIAHIENEFPEKFGIPRQSGLVEEVKSRIVFEPEYRDANAFRGMEGYSHIWLIWQFSEAVREDWSPMVKPPRLGGNKRMGVFATRSPFRPNAIGLSSVKLEKIEFTKNKGPVLVVSGADLMDGTPIFDVKPYLPFTDSHPEAMGGFADEVKDYKLEVIFPEEWKKMIPAEHLEAVEGILAGDPRPAYQNDPERVYGFYYAGFDVRFQVKEGTITVCEIVRM